MQTKRISKIRYDCEPSGVGSVSYDPGGVDSISYDKEGIMLRIPYNGYVLEYLISKEYFKNIFNEWVQEWNGGSENDCKRTI